MSYSFLPNTEDDANDLAYCGATIADGAAFQRPRSTHVVERRRVVEPRLAQSLVGVGGRGRAASASSV
jgi:hypothetical protein